MAGNGQYVLEIILRARDELNSKINETRNKMNQLGNASKTAMDTARNATQQANSTMKQQETAVNSLSQKYASVKDTVTNAFNNIKSVITNSNPSKYINSESISQPFKNAAESIRNKWQTVMQNIQSNKPRPTVDTSGITNSTGSINNFKANFNTINSSRARPVIDVSNLNSSREVINNVRNNVLSLNSARATPTINTSGLNMGKQAIADFQAKINTINTMSARPRFEILGINESNGKIQILLRDLQQLRTYPIQTNASGLTRLNATLQTIINDVQKVNGTPVNVKVNSSGLAALPGQLSQTQARMQGVNTTMTETPSRIDRIKSGFSTLTGSLSMLQSTIMGAFGAVGVTSLSQFTIGAAIARQRINAVTQSVVGSKEALNSMNSAISRATSGGVVGFNKVATAVQQIGIKHNLTNAQLEKTPPLLNKIGTLAIAMGKDGDTAANLMARAYDGLNGNFMLLQRNFGITKQQLLDAGWSGAASDVDGYTAALQKVLDQKPEMQEYLNSYEGQMARMQMAIQGVGRQIGEVLLPFINALLSGFLWLNEKCPWLTTGLVLLGIAIVGIASAAMMLLPIMEILTLKIGEQAVYQAILNSTMLANPYVIVALAIIALIAVMAYLYTTNESVKNAFDEMGRVINGILVNAWNTLLRIVQPLYPTFEHLVQVFNHLWQVLTGTSAVTEDASGHIDVLGAVAKALAFIVEVVVTGIVKHIEFLAAIFIPVINLIINILSAVINLIASFAEAFQLLASGDIVGFLATIGEALATFQLEILGYFGEFLIELLNNLGTVFLGAGAMVGDWMLQLITNGINGAIAFVNGIIMWIMTLPSRVSMWLTQVLTYIGLWAGNIVLRARNAGLNMVNGFIQYVMSLPGKLWSWLLQTAQKIGSFASQAYSNMIQAGARLVEALRTKASQLPQIMWDELMRIGDKIRNAAGELVAAIIQLGKNLLLNFKKALGIASPGFMFDAISGEMDYIGGAMTNAETSLANKAEGVGQSILNGFENTDLSSIGNMVESNIPTDINPMATVTPLLSMGSTQSTGSTDPNASPTGEEGTPMLTPELAENSTLLSDSFLEASALINPELLLLTQNINNMALASTTSTQTALLNNQQAIMSYNNMQLAISSSLNTIQNRNVSAWNNIKQTTLTNLNSILSSTKSVTSQMISAWEHMKTSIVKAADDIKSQSSSRFEQLWSTIKTFYHNIQHPGGAGSPTGHTRPRRSGSSNGFKQFSTIIRNTISNDRGNVNKRVLIENGLKYKDIDYLFPNGSNIAKSDLLNYVNEMNGLYGGEWGDVVQPNVKWIRDTTNEWETAPPVIINKYNTSQGFKVGDFENGTPNISFDYFRRMAEDVFSQCHYEFYWNSERYGHWIPAFHNGGMNCDDSTEALMAMARACGLSATKVHGHWNQYGHYWANIAGHKMDTTGWMNRRTWTPSASHAGSPTGEIEVEDKGIPVIIELLNRIIDLLTVKNQEPMEINLNKQGTINVNATHELTNVPDLVDEQTVSNMIQEVTNDKGFLKALTSSDDFQELDRKYKNKLLNEIARFS